MKAKMVSLVCLLLYSPFLVGFDFSPFSVSDVKPDLSTAESVGLILLAVFVCVLAILIFIGVVRADRESRRSKDRYADVWPGIRQP